MRNSGSRLQDFLGRHQPLCDIAQVERVVNELNNQVNGRGFYFQWDVGTQGSFLSYEALPDDTVAVISSFDFSYYYDLEIIFHDAINHTLPGDNEPWPDHWTKDQIMLMPTEDAKRFMDSVSIPFNPSYHLFAFNRGSHSDVTYLVLAKGISYCFGTVYYYDRLANDPLFPGERIAWWVS